MLTLKSSYMILKNPNKAIKKLLMQTDPEWNVEYLLMEDVHGLAVSKYQLVTVPATIKVPDYVMKKNPHRK